MGLDCCSPGSANVFSGSKVNIHTSSIPSGTSFLTWSNNDSDFYDTDNYFTTADRERLTAPFDGRYLIVGQLEIASSTSGVIITPTRSDGYINNRCITPASLGTVTAVSVQMLMTITLNVGDYMRFQANNLNAFAVGMSANFAISMTLLGKL